MIDVFLNKVKDYSIDYLDNKIKIYGISQNPDTNDYMMVLGDHYGEMYCINCEKPYKNGYKWCEPCQMKYLKGEFKNWTSGNERIDYFIQEMQSKIDCPTDNVFEWISFNQFS
ncbi:hypothetical protein RhiirC2_751330, partial [Rhizophagus irregularis]